MVAKKTSSSPITKRPRAAAKTASKAEATPTAVKAPARPRARRQPTKVVTADQIRERAYFLSLERGGGPGDPEADWARAERELVGASKA